MSRPFAHLISLFSFLFIISLSISPALAFDNPSQYFDWSPVTLDSRVLGLSDQTEVSPSVNADHHEYQQFSYPLDFTADLNSSNPFYFLKRAQEGLRLTFTFDPLQKEKYRLELAGERLSELGSLKGDVSKAAESYRKTINTLGDNLTALKNDGKNIAELAALIDLESAKHGLVLEEIELQAETSDAESLGNALAASQNATDTVADVMDRPPLPPELLSRLESLRAQGLLSQEEVSALSSVDSRKEARTKLRGYTESRLLPETDFKKLDETARIFFPQGYNTNLEIKKFQELKDLENTRPDDVTLTRVQDFAKQYQAGDPIPSDLRRWWAPMVRLEELNNTLRPDLISPELFRGRPDDQQKFQEYIERSKPRQEDVEYINHQISRNPELQNDPAFARLLALGTKYGANSSGNNLNTLQSCGQGTHWVTIAFMPGGGYCVPNYTYAPPTGDNQERDNPCPPGYHRNGPGSACYPDNSNGPGVASLPARGTCPAGYRWNNTYCAPEYTGSGTYPSPTMSNSFCPAGEYFGPGGVCTNNSKSNENNQVNTTSTPRCQPPSGGCPGSNYYDWGTCSCRPSTNPNNPTVAPNYSYSANSHPPSVSKEQQEATCKAGGGTCVSWVNNACGCERSGGNTPYVPSASNCSPGSTWNGSYCASSGGPTPSSAPAPNLSRDSQESACRSCGGSCSWNGDTCGCQCGTSQSSNPTPTPAQTLPPENNPTPPPQPVESTPAPSP